MERQNGDALGRALAEAARVLAPGGRLYCLLHSGDSAVVQHGGARLAEKQPGLGIGLAVVNELVGAYGGEVAVERSGLGGAAVRVTLPAA
jgi:SAM-dependent methyltransferase